MARPSDLTIEKRTEIVLSLLRREEPTSVLARRHGISEKTLNTWKEAFISGGTAQLASSQKQRRIERERLEQLNQAVKERDLVIGELTIANRLLKKTGSVLPSTKRSGRR